MAYFWPFSPHNCHARGCTFSISKYPPVLAYRSAISTQGMTSKYGPAGQAVASSCVEKKQAKESSVATNKSWPPYALEFTNGVTLSASRGTHSMKNASV